MEIAGGIVLGVLVLMGCVLALGTAHAKFEDAATAHVSSTAARKRLAGSAILFCVVAFLGWFIFVSIG